jgi:hypothetical protein
MFVFEKKKQKTFASSQQLTGAVRDGHHKSFLLLFSKRQASLQRPTSLLHTVWF